MHTMDKTPRIVTIIGLIFEGLNVVGTLVGGLFLRNFESFPLFDLAMAEMSAAEIDEVLELFAWLSNILIGMAIVVGVFFLVNLVLFTRLMQGRYTEEAAKKVYLYQAVWGGVNVALNLITGILYLVSGVTGYGGHKEERNIRTGI
jgi:hypothetical protein